MFQLYILQVYKTHLTRNNNLSKSQEIEGTIDLLKHTSKVKELFHDKHVIHSVDDCRLHDLTRFYQFLTRWHDATNGESDQFISQKLWFDLKSMIFGFHSIVHIKLNEYPHSVIKPAIVNQDVVEGHFYQVRACNGQSNHPTWRLQEAAQNTIRYGQTTISRKSNTGTDGRKRK